MGSIIYAKNYNPVNTLFHAWHHAGGTITEPYRSASGNTINGVDAAHRDRDFNKSLLDWYIGYNFVILTYPVLGGIGPRGNIVQTRAIGETTCAQKGYNFSGKVISICFLNKNFNLTAGGVMVDRISPIEVEAARWLDSAIAPQLPLLSNKPHRFFGMTECYGTGLNEAWIVNLLNKKIYSEGLPELQKKLSTLQQLLELYRKLLTLMENAKLGWMRKEWELERFGFYQKYHPDCNDADLIG